MSLTLSFGLSHGHVPSNQELKQFEDKIVAGYAASYITNQSGKRKLQANNSWLRNLLMLNKVKPLCAQG